MSTPKPVPVLKVVEAVQSATVNKVVEPVVAVVAEPVVAVVTEPVVAESKRSDFLVKKTPSGQFEIRGDGFSCGGSVLIGGTVRPTFEWNSQYIRGSLEGVESGIVVVQIDQHTSQIGYLK